MLLGVSFNLLLLLLFLPLCLSPRSPSRSLFWPLLPLFLPRYLWLLALLPSPVASPPVFASRLWRTLPSSLDSTWRGVVRPHLLALSFARLSGHLWCSVLIFCVSPPCFLLAPVVGG